MKYTLFLILLFVILSRCIGIPNFSNTPEISLNNLFKINKFNADQKANLDSINFAINYQDGDGDLGMDTGEKDKAPFTGEYAFNFITTGYRKVNGRYQVFKNNEKFKYNYPKLNPQGKKTPLKGTIHLGFWLAKPDAGTEYKAGDTLRFDVYIYDRSLNKSNTITTNEIVLSK
jgi:hypothetical protein